MAPLAVTEPSTAAAPTDPVSRAEFDAVLAEMARLEELLFSVHLGTFGGSAVFPVLIAPFPLEVLSVGLTAAAAVPASNTDYWVMTLRNVKAPNGAYAGPFARRTTSPLDGGGISPYRDWNFDGVPFDADHRLARSDVLSVGFGRTGAPKNVVAATVTVRYRPT